MKNYNQSENINQNTPLYPKEAYQNENISNNEAGSTTEQNNAQNIILPLLLQAINGDKDFDIGKILSLMPNNQNNNLGLINALSNLGKNKKKEAPKLDTSEKPFPKNEFIY